MTKDNPIWLTEDHLAALVSPRTREVFGAFRSLGPASVDQVQRFLDCPSKSVYYQVSKLQRAGLLSEAGSQKGARREKQIYAAPTGSLRMPEGFQGAQYERLAAKGTEATLKQTARQFKKAAELAETRPELVDSLYVRTSAMKLSPPQIKALTQRLQELCDEYESAPTTDNLTVSVLCVLTPHQSQLD